MRTSEQTDKLWPAIVAAKKAMKNPKKDAENPAFKRDGKAMKYADLAAVLEVIDEACEQHGLVTLQEPTGDAAGVAVSTIILHESGQWVQFDPLFMPATKLDPQGFGSATTYARRYSVKGTWNLADEDDDGNAASQKKPQPKPSAPLAVPAGYDDWLDDLKAHAQSQGMTLDVFRQAYAKSKPEHRKYLETHNSGLLKQLTATLPKAA
jgi:hypothetical protein